MEQETLTEVAVSVGAVVAFVVAFVGIGVVYGSGSGEPNGTILTGAGGLALVGGITFFVVLMAVAGYWLAGQQQAA